MSDEASDSKDVGGQSRLNVGLGLTKEIKMELETINKLYLELSQVATAKTKRELDLESALSRSEFKIISLEAYINSLPRLMITPC